MCRDHSAYSFVWYVRHYIVGVGADQIVWAGGWTIRTGRAEPVSPDIIPGERRHSPEWSFWYVSPVLSKSYTNDTFVIARRTNHSPCEHEIWVLEMWDIVQLTGNDSTFQNIIRRTRSRTAFNRAFLETGWYTKEPPMSGLINSHVYLIPIQLLVFIAHSPNYAINLCIYISGEIFWLRIIINIRLSVMHLNETILHYQ